MSRKKIAKWLLANGWTRSHKDENGTVYFVNQGALAPVTWSAFDRGVLVASLALFHGVTVEDLLEEMLA